MTSRSKTHYHGQKLRRVHRSELEDGTMRDQARHNAKLEQSLKTVERAKNVMVKSMEADRHLFVKTGPPKGKVSKSQSSQPPARQPAPPQTRLVSDSRVKRTTDVRTTSGGKSSSADAQKQQPETTEPTQKEKLPKVSSGADIRIPELDSSSIYDKFLADNTSSSKPRNGKNKQYT